MNTLKIFENVVLLEKSLKITEENYRPYDPGWYLYGILSKFNGNKYSHEFIELVYVTLSAWNMNSRGAKLNDFDLFKKTIIDNKKIMEKLSNKNIGNIENEETKKLLQELFFKLKLVFENKPILVTFSKTMHFFFPNLIVPIDRTYTCNYFYGNTNIPYDKNRQFNKFFEIENEFSQFYKTINLKKYISKDWNLCETKIMDNMIIGYLKLVKYLTEKKTNEINNEDKKILKII